MFQHLFQKSSQWRHDMTQVIENIGGEYRNRTGVHGFAIQPLSQRNQAVSVSKDDPTNREHSEKVSNADLTGEKENAATSAKVSGAKDVVEGVYLCGDYIAAFPILAMHWGALV